MGKIGVGIYGFNQQSLDGAITMQPSPVMLTDPPVEFYNELRAKLPASTRYFLRRWVNPDDQTGMLGNPTAAQEYAYHCIDLALRLPGLSGVLALNETPCDADSLRQYDMFQVDFISEVQYRFGLPVVAHNFGVGNPQAADAVSPYDPTNDPLVTMKSASMAKYIGVHLYGAPGEPIDGQSQNWYALRYRMFMKDLKAAGKRVPLFLATESGGNEGWKGVIEPGEYFRQVSWLQDQFNQDVGVMVGQCLFGLWGNGQWPGFDMVGSPLVDMIATYNRTH